MNVNRRGAMVATSIAVAAISTLAGCGAAAPATSGTATVTGHPTQHAPLQPTGGAPTSRPSTPSHHQPSSTVHAHVTAAPKTGHAQPRPQRPNIVMITADDATPRDLKYMPLTQKLLIARGVTFTDAVAPDPICVPARASLLTGQYTHNHHAYTISGVGGGAQSFNAAKTLPVWLQHAGYDTLFLGKYLNGYGDPGSDRLSVEPGWTQWRPTVGGSTYNFMHPILNINGHRLVHYHEYNSNLLEQQTKLLLNKPERHRKPWYLWVNYTAPHTGGPHEASDPQRLYPNQPQDWIATTHPAPRDEGRFAGIQEPQIPDMFRSVPGELSDGPGFTPTQQAMVRIAFEQRVEAVQSVDRAIAATINTLRRKHMLANTYIIFGSDNGYLVGQHNHTGKLVHFNDSERIPLVMAGPGLPHGVKLGTAVTNPDIATTIAALAHARPERPQDGVNIVPWVRRGYRDRVIPIEAYRVHGGTRPIYNGVREGSWTYVHYYHWNDQDFEEMYNRAIDPFELHNLALDPAYKPQLRRFRRLTARYKDCAGNTCPKQFRRPAQVPLLYGPSSRLGF